MLTIKVENGNITSLVFDSMNREENIKVICQVSVNML